MGFIGGFCHLYIGQEAVVIGMQAGDRRRRPDRSPPTATTATCWPWSMDAARRHGRADRAPRRLSRGKGGSMHMFSKEKHFYGGHGIVGAQVSLGTGLAFANRYRGNKNVSLTYLRRRRRQPGPGL